MKLNGKDFYCPHSGVCICAATNKRRPSKECESITKRRINSNRKKWRKLVSHDRGCACGKERSEYSSCVDPNCFKREAKMKDTDWRPSPCPECGEMRKAARHPVCRNVDCVNDVVKRHLKTMKTEKQYLWIRPNSVETPMLIIDDPVSIFRSAQFDESVDKLYQIGNEVKMKVVVEPVPNYRLGDEKMKTVRAVSGKSYTSDNYRDIGVDE